MQKLLNGTRLSNLELRRIDIFGYQITLRMNQYSTYRTALGGTISLCVIGIMILQFQASFYSFLNKEQLSAIAVTEYDPNVANSMITAEDFLFAIAIEQSNFITRPFFNVSLTQKYQYRYQNGSQLQEDKQLKLVQCTQLRFQQYFELQDSDFSGQYFNSSSLDEYLCPEENFNFELGGTYISAEFLYLQLTITKCNVQNALDAGFECASEEQLTSYLQTYGSFKFQIYNTNQVINPYNPNDNYKQTYLDDALQYSFIPNSLGRSVDVYLRYYEISKDISLSPLRYSSMINSDIVVEQAYIIDQLETKVISELGQNEYVTINFKRSPFQTKISRSYLKFDEMLSNLGGIQQIIFFFVGIIVTLYNKLQMMIELANRVYEFSLDNSEQKRQQQEKLDLINLAMERQQQLPKEPGSSVNNSDEDDKPQTIHQTLIHQKENNLGHRIEVKPKKLKAMVSYLNAFRPVGNQEIVKQRKEGFRMILDQQLLAIQLNCKNGLEYFEKQIQNIIGRAKPIELSLKVLLNIISCNKIFSNQPRIVLLNKGIMQIADQMDIYSIVQKMNEMTKLKEVVLSFNQLLMFNFTPKPQITLDDQTAQPTRDNLQIKLNSERETNDQQYEESNIFKKKRGSRDSENYLFYAKIYNVIIKGINQSYDDVLRQSEIDVAIKNNISKQLIEKLGPELQSIFKLSKLIDFQSQNSTQQQVKTPFRRGAMQQQEQNVYAKMFDLDK